MITGRLYRIPVLSWLIGEICREPRRNEPHYSASFMNPVCSMRAHVWRGKSYRPCADHRLSCSQSALVPVAAIHIFEKLMMERTEVWSTTETDAEFAFPGVSERFLEFIGEPDFPCVGAKSALARGLIQTHEFDALGDSANDPLLLYRLSRFAAMIEAAEGDGSMVHSCVAIFRGPFDLDELRFESLLWEQLWRLHRLDVLAGNPPADDVSSDSQSARFSMSLAGHPFFLVGLHPQASRLARRFSHPVMVFNSHRQFDRLKDDGRFEKMQTATRSRDIDLQGSLNPNLANYGEISEARQYSGREVGEGWRCPFDFRTRH